MEEKHEDEYKRLSEYTWYMVRVAEVSDLSWSYVKELTVKLKCPYIVSKEVSKEGKDHIHMVIVAKCKDDVSAVIKGHWPTAVGNKCLYIKQAKSFKQASKYVVKDGDFDFNEISQGFIEDLYQLSHPKEDPMALITSLEEKLSLKLITFKEFTKEYIQIKVDAGQGIYVNHIQAYIRMQALKNGYMDIYEFTNSLVDSVCV